MNESQIQAQAIYENIDPNDENALYKVIDMAKRLERITIELKERIETMESVVNE